MAARGKENRGEMFASPTKPIKTAVQMTIVNLPRQMWLRSSSGRIIK